MSLNYTSYVNSLANLFPTQVADPGFQLVLPNIIDDAEQRIYRELDLLNTVVTDFSSAFTTGRRSFPLPTSIGTYVVVNQVYAITPAGTTVPNNGTRNPLTPCSREYLDFTWPSSVGSTVPQYFAMTTQSTIIVGPWPDQAYQVEVSGTQRPAPLSTTNITTLLSWYLPDLFMAASLVFGYGYMKDFGGMGGPGSGPDQANASQSWEAHYQLLKASAATEESRKKFTQAGWSSKQPSPDVTPPRT